MERNWHLFTNYQFLMKTRQQKKLRLNNWYNPSQLVNQWQQKPITCNKVAYFSLCVMFSKTQNVSSLNNNDWYKLWSFFKLLVPLGLNRFHRVLQWRRPLSCLCGIWSYCCHGCVFSQGTDNLWDILQFWSNTWAFVLSCIVV